MPVYLDCAATTPIDPRVMAEVIRFMAEEFGNAGSRTHDFGTRARRAVEKARDQVAAVVAAGRGEVVFTSGATESNNLAILGMAGHGQSIGKRHLVSTQIEHHAVLEPLQAMSRQGFEVTLVAPELGGWTDPQVIRRALRADTLLVSAMHVNNETGTVQPIEEIAAILADHPAYFHVDAAQGFGKQIAALRHPRIDLISISGHKIYAPKGIGALITRRRGSQRLPLTPLMFGGGQERGLRPGTLPVHLIVGLGLAAELAMREVNDRNAVCLRFRERLIDALLPLGPLFHGDESRSLPQILNLSFPGIDGDSVIEALAEVVAISNGSACTSQSLTCSHVLDAMNIRPAEAEGALRWSWCHQTPDPDWQRVREIIASFQSRAPGAGV